MSAHNEAYELSRSPINTPDPGDAGSIVSDRTPQSVGLISAAAETRTLARPTRIGSTMTLFMRSDGGDITVTVTGGYNEAGETTLTFDDAGQFAVFQSFYDGTDYFWRLISHSSIGTLPANSAEVVTATNVISASESGKTFFLDAAAGFTSTLPAPALGLEFVFIVKTAVTSNGYTIITTSGADIIVIGVNELEVDTGDDGPYDINADSVVFEANVAVPGDYLKFYCDGTKWYAIGQTNADGGITTSTT